MFRRAGKLLAELRDIADLNDMQKSNRGGIIDDTLPEHEAEEQGCSVLVQHAQHCHGVCRRKDAPERKAVLSQPATSLYQPSGHAMRLLLMYIT